MISFGLLVPSRTGITLSAAIRVTFRPLTGWVHCPTLSPRNEWAGVSQSRGASGDY